MPEPSRARPHAAPRCQPLRYRPTAAEIDALIAAAAHHALGLEFLQRGHLGTVAVTFHAHAFTVVAARERLAGAER
jgi:hypothetical protein